MVDCTGEGVLFIEADADADVTLEEFGDSLHPHFPCFKELLCEPPGSNNLLNSPVLQIQVTRLKCGGFIFAHRLNHTMSDAAGLIQFMCAMGEIARGAVAPSIPPVWERHLLNARQPPLITCEHHEYDHATANLVHRSFFFRTTQISALKRFISDNLCCSTFEILTAFIWRCRSIALQLGPDEDVRFICVVNARELIQNPLEYAVKLVKKAKVKATEDYMKSTADLLVSRGRPHVNTTRSLLVSDQVQGC
ncbi:hypothetical protein like AT5G17540 [Hibiscus trionum]|uniref:Uncharacterized protein n=1 Tax=Hibiscus trionum TaxID=183268 RepID=A0A9W7M2R7_HIBTR|nr:hypothetical protein like AT5G17540 [Hibiscus trionum]